MRHPLFRRKSIAQLQADSSSVSPHSETEKGLKKILTVKDLTFMGIAAVVGAGIFSTIGTAAASGGPGISLLFVVTAITCGFSALCYAEFASRVPIAGSAYTYAYVSFGELVAWVIGWALILEYGIGNIVVSISWSSYFNNLLNDVGLHLPGWLTVDPTTAQEAYQSVLAKLQQGAFRTPEMNAVVEAWEAAPVLFGHKVFLNIPAFLIVVLITGLTYIGIKESKRSANFMVIFKLVVIGFIIVLGFYYVQPSHWSPFLPNGFGGVLKGVSAVFFAYIGFDAISTTAEECKNPQRDLPRGMMYSLLICTVLYILVSLVLTGMVPFTELKVNDPLAYVFQQKAPWIETVVSISAVVATTSVLLVFQLGQPRIWMSMSRDGLLPRSFGKVHPRYQTPYFSTLVTGLLVAIPSLFMQSSLMTDLTSIGTLFAFVIVAGGVMLLPRDTSAAGRSFRLPYINGQFIVPALWILFCYLLRDRISTAFFQWQKDDLQELLFLLYTVLSGLLAMATWLRKLSLIPIIGVLSCAYLLIEIPAISWIWFFGWMGIGLCIYGFYGFRKSHLASPR